MFNVEEYQKLALVGKFKELKSQTLEGSTFKIKKLSQKEILTLTGSLAVFNQAQVKHSDTDFGGQNIDLEKQLEFAESLIIASVVEPKISIIGEKDTLRIDYLSQEDYEFLVAEITKFSMPTEKKKKKLTPSSK